MSYLVMARRWRPQRFADVVGQEHVTRTLRQAIARGRVAHAYLFTGPRGVGKTTTARLLAMAVNDTEPVPGPDGLPDLNPDTETNREIAAGNALDVIEIDGASNNKVDDVRQLRETIKYAPSVLRTKVYIIDEVHMLSAAAFNALLKTLEEPPDHAMFIFATTEAHKVPATVVSRCQRYDFKRISTKEIRSQLERIVEGDQLDVSGDALTAIAVKADGALRDALSILDQLVAYQGGEAITEEVVRSALGLIGGEIYFRTTDIAATGDVAGALAIADDLTAGGHDAREFLRGLQQHVLRYLYLKAGGGQDELAVTEEERDRYAATLDRLSDEDLLRIGEWAAEAEDVLRDALDPVLRLELLLVRIARMDRAVDIGALLQRMGVAPGSFRQPRQHPGQGGASGATPGSSPSTPSGGSGGGTPASGAPSGGSSGGAGPADSNGSSRPADDPTAQANPGDSLAATASTDDDASNGTSPAPADDTASPPPPAPQAATSASASGTPAAEAGEQREEEGADNSDDDSPDNGDNSDSEPDGLTLSSIHDGWADFCEKVNEAKALLGSHLENGAPTTWEGGALEITFDPNANFVRENVFRNRDTIAVAFRRFYGVPARLQVQKGEVPEHLRPERPADPMDQKRRQFDEVLEERPVWKEMVDRFQLG